MVLPRRLIFTLFLHHETILMVQIPDFYTAFESSFLERGDSVLSEKSVSSGEYFAVYYAPMCNHSNMFLTFSLTVGDRR